MKRLKNSTKIPDDTVRAVVAFVNEQLGLSQFDVEVRNCSGTLAGTAYTKGCSLHATSRPFVVLRVGTEKIKVRSNFRVENGRRKTDIVNKGRFPTFVTPYQRGQHKGRKVALANRLEALVYIAAHEMRHLWQEARRQDGRKANPDAIHFYGVKGKFSEVDTESFALHELRAWRTRILP
jgi:hypothetical protein